VQLDKSRVEKEFTKHQSYPRRSYKREFSSDAVQLNANDFRHFIGSQPRRPSCNVVISPIKHTFFFQFFEFMNLSFFGVNRQNPYFDEKTARNALRPG